jgi:hypothetical protein
MNVFSNAPTEIIDPNLPMWKVVLLLVGIPCALVLFLAFRLAEQIFARPFEEHPLLPGACAAWCVAQIFGQIAAFAKNEVEENLSMLLAGD